jgi:hypothetical protein
MRHASVLTEESDWTYQGRAVALLTLGTASEWSYILHNQLSNFKPIMKDGLRQRDCLRIDEERTSSYFLCARPSALSIWLLVTSRV